MNKDQEIKHFNHFVENYPEDSYLKPWLLQVRYELERNLRSDMIPSISLNDAQKIAEKIIEEAQTKAKLIVINAEKAEKETLQRIENVHNHAGSVLRSALRNLNEY